MKIIQQLMVAGLGISCALPILAQDSDSEAVSSDSIATNYVGDNYRIGIGYGSETHLTGEFFWAFAEQPDSAWVAEGWLGDGGAGGLKLNYHFLSNGVQAGLDEQGQPVYSDGTVRKLFLAADRNRYDDAKLSLGFGSEKNNRFWSVYGSKSITGERFIGQNISYQEQVVNGLVNNHTFTRTDTLETITDFYAHPYDWGVGVRFGRYLEDYLLRLRAGLDYESGDYDSSQLTAFAGLEKRFANSPHGISLRAEALRKDGDFEIDKNDFRVTAFWTWDFGSTFHPVSAYRNVQVERMPDPATLAPKEVVDVVQNRVTLDNASSFDLDSSRLNPPALAALDEVIASLGATRIAGDVLVVGHTCSLGTDAYNQALSERRARAVYDYLTANGVDPGLLRWEGQGESSPRYSNETEESRKRNRRVEISFTSEEEVIRKVPVGEGQPVTEWVQEAVPVEAAWIRRALRNPVVHKRTVDYYRINRVSENLIEGEPVVDNTGPAAVDDAYAVDQDSSGNLLPVLLNDSDAEGDGLTIVSLGSPAHGTAVISGDQVSYTPNEGYVGSDSFSYTIEDGYGGSASAMVSITVNRANTAPLAVDDQYQVDEASGENTLDVLANDSDPDGDTFSLSAVTPPAHGSATISGDVITYTPEPGFFGTDVFTYTIEDSLGLQATATVTITVRERNLPPVAVDDTAITRKNHAVVIDVLANDSDPNGDPLSVVEIIQSANKMGTVVINGDGTLSYDPMPGWWGGDSFQYRISDGRGGSAMATVVLTVTED